MTVAAAAGRIASPRSGAGSTLRRGAPQGPAAGAREAPLADAHAEDRRPLQPLRAVHREQLDRSRPRTASRPRGRCRPRPRPSARRSAPARVTSPSTAWKSATALTNRSRFSRRAAAALLTDDASSTSTPVTSMIRRTRSRSGSPTDARSSRSSSRSSAKRSRASAEYAASPGSARASSRHGISAGSMPSAISTSCSCTVSGASAAPADARPARGHAGRAGAGRAARSAQRGPASSASSDCVVGDVLDQLEGGHHGRRSRAAAPAPTGRRSRPARRPRSGRRRQPPPCWLSRLSTRDLRPGPCPSHASRSTSWTSQASSSRCGLEDRDPDRARLARAVAQPGDLVAVLLQQRRSQRVRDVEDAGVGASVHGQRQHRDRAPVRRREDVRRS